MRGIQSVNDPNQIPTTDSKKKLDFLRNVCEDCFWFIKWGHRKWN